MLWKIIHKVVRTKMKTGSKKELFENMPIPRAIAVMAIPTIISQLINLIYNMVDTFFIGRTGNSYMVAAVTVAFPLFMMNVAFSNLFGIGGGSLMARLIGIGREGDARRVSAFGIYGSVLIALVYSLLVYLFMEPLLRLLGASDSTAGFARQYTVLVVIIGSLPTILSTAGAHLLRNVGYSKQASIGLSGGGILNMILDPLFMFVLFPRGWEVFGAALATLLSNVVACIYMLFMINRVSRSSSLSLRPGDIRGIRREDVKGIFVVGVPSAILTGLFDVANIVLNALMALHGDLALAAIGIVMKAERLPNAINIGICQGMMPIVAYNYSSGNRERMDQVIRTARRYGLLIAFCSMALFELLASPIIRVFLSTSAGNAEEALATIAFGILFIRVRCLASPVQFLNYHTSYCLQAMGDGRDTLLHAIGREILFYIPFMFLLNQLFGTMGLVCALIAGEGCGALFALFLLRRWLARKSESEAGKNEAGK